MKTLITILIVIVTGTLVWWLVPKPVHESNLDSTSEMNREDGDATVNTYINEHISDLSSVKASLGGTFYVTSMDAHDGKGVVSYEDGHNAYTADFTYLFNEDRSVKVDWFKVRQ